MKTKFYVIKKIKKIEEKTIKIPSIGDGPCHGYDDDVVVTHYISALMIKVLSPVINIIKYIETEQVVRVKEIDGRRTELQRD